MRHCRLVNFPLGKLTVWNEQGDNDADSGVKILEPYKEEKPQKTVEEWEESKTDEKTKAVTKAKKTFT